MKVGDRVRIVTKAYEGNVYAPHFGVYGTIERQDNERQDKLHSNPLLLIRRDGDIRAIWYFEDDLECECESEIVTAPDFSLDEIALGEEIISQMD